METTKNKPLASPKEDTLVGNGMSKREARKIRMQSMNKSEIAYMRRKRVFDAVWPFFRFFILFGLCFVILYPLIYMISCAFRDSADMSDPTVMWIPRHLTLNVIKETADVMDIWNTLKTTLLLNVGCTLLHCLPHTLSPLGLLFDVQNQCPLYLHPDFQSVSHWWFSPCSDVSSVFLSQDVFLEQFLPQIHHPIHWKSEFNSR